GSPPPGGRRSPRAAPGCSGRCGPPPASRTRRSPTPCTWWIWWRQTRSTPCPRPRCTRPRPTARCAATRSTERTTSPGRSSSSSGAWALATTTWCRCWSSRACRSSRQRGTSFSRQSGPRWPPRPRPASEPGAARRRRDRMTSNPLRDPRDRRIPRVAEPCVLVLFGVTGDLATKKLLPAIYDLANRGLLPPGFSLVGFARRDWEDEDFARLTHDAVKAHARTPFRDAVWQQVYEGVRFVPGEFGDDEAFDRLADT